MFLVACVVILVQRNRQISFSAADFSALHHSAELASEAFSALFSHHRENAQSAALCHIGFPLVFHILPRIICLGANNRVRQSSTVFSLSFRTFGDLLSAISLA